MRAEPAATRWTWEGGWLQAARHCLSPNFGPRPVGAHVDLIVIHSISLPPGVYGGPEVEYLFTNRLDWDAHPYFQQIRGMEVSSHFFIRRDGELVQFVIYSVMVAGSVGALSEIWGELQRAAGATERLVELLTVQDSVLDPAAPLALPRPVRPAAWTRRPGSAGPAPAPPHHWPTALPPRLAPAAHWHGAGAMPASPAGRARPATAAPARPRGPRSRPAGARHRCPSPARPAARSTTAAATAPALPASPAPRARATTSRRSS